MLTQLSHVTMVVRDLTATRDLYRDTLGLPERGQGTDPEGREVCVLGVGPSVLELRGDPLAPAADPAVRSVVDHFALLVDDMDEAYATLRDRGVPLLGEPSATAIGHRNMQRALLAFEDHDGFHVQISQTIDPRPEAESRKAAKRRMSGSSEASDLFRGFDHISSYCTDYDPARTFYRDRLGLEEFFYSTAREPGQAVDPGFAQGAYAVGGTDIELATAGRGLHVHPVAVAGLGFFSDDVDGDGQRLRGQGIDVQPVATEWIAWQRRRSLIVPGPHGLHVEICQAPGA